MNKKGIFEYSSKKKVIKKGVIFNADKLSPDKVRHGLSKRSDKLKQFINSRAAAPQTENQKKLQKEGTAESQYFSPGGFERF